MQYKLVGIGAVSAGKLYAGMMALTAAILLLPITLIMSVASGKPLDSLMALIAIPFYALFGFISGIIVAIVFSFIAKKIGGLEFEIQKNK